MNHAITIAGNAIRQDVHGRFCLNDLHRAAGGEPKHRPSRWLDNQQTKELVSEIEIAGIRAIETIQKKGTFGCRELVYCYAMWISPIFHLKVIRAYDTLVTAPSTAPQAAALPVVITPASLQAMLDKPENMQWLTVEAHKHKTRRDIRKCRKYNAEIKDVDTSAK